MPAPTPLLWEKQEGETQPEYDLFCIFRDQTALNRDLRNVRRCWNRDKLGQHSPEVEADLISRNEWHKRFEAKDIAVPSESDARQARRMYRFFRDQSATVTFAIARISALRMLRDMKTNPDMRLSVPELVALMGSSDKMAAKFLEEPDIRAEFSTKTKEEIFAMTMEEIIQAKHDDRPN